MRLVILSEGKALSVQMSNHTDKHEDIDFSGSGLELEAVFVWKTTDDPNNEVLDAIAGTLGGEKGLGHALERFANWAFFRGMQFQQARENNKLLLEADSIPEEG